MGVADEQIEKIRWKRQAERTLKDDDFNLRLFFLGWLLFLFLGVVASRAFGHMMLIFLTRALGRPEELEIVMYGYLAAYFGVFGYFFGQLMGMIVMRHLGKRWRGNLHFGKHPVFFIILASWLSFNICFVLLLSLILSFK